jgi:hypothetical protein
VNANQRLVTGTELKVMVCPSDLVMPPALNPDGAQGTFAKGNYGLNFGGGSANENGNSNNRAGPDDVPTWTTNAPNASTPGYGRASKNRGMASLRDNAQNLLPSGVGMNEMLDGTSNCLILGEMLKLNHVTQDCRGCWGKALGAAISAYTKGNPQTQGPNAIATPNVRAVGIYRDGPTHCAESFSIGDLQLECSGSSGDGLGGNAMRSRHPGGVQACFGDARVTFISNTVNKLAYRAMFTLQGGETINAQ